MTVSVTISKTLNGAAAADDLAGTGTGFDIGTVRNNQYGPIISKTGNTGKQDVYIRHDAVTDPITDFSVHIQEYGVGTSYTYGGANTAADDYASLIDLGLNSGSSKNNADGLSGGFWMEMDADVATVNAFNQASRPTLVKIFGDSGSPNGSDLDNRYLVAADAMVRDNGGVESLPSAPVAGQIGKTADTVLGDRCHLQFRLYLPQAFTEGGVLQWETVFSYAFTS